MRGYSIKRYVFSHGLTPQECVMSNAHGPRRQAASLAATPRSFLAAILSLACVFSAGLDVPLVSAAPAPAKDKKPKQDPVLKNLPITELSSDEAILHALNRLAYGPRPGDVERVRQMGLAKWIEQQLNPNSIDDKALDARLQDYPTLRMSSAKLIEEYPGPKQQEKQAAKRAQAQLERDEQRRSDTAAAVVAKDMQSSSAPKDAAETSTDASQNDPQNPAAAQSGTASTDPNAASPMKDEPPQEIPAARGAGKRGLQGGDPNNIARALDENSRRPQRVVAELAMAKVTRAIYSERQLQQVMDDFWFNHFNVFAGKGEDRYYLTAYERDVIQPHALGKFKDLLTASAKSPAMLFYLDNFLSADPRAAQRLAQERAMRQQWRYRRFGQPLPPRPPQGQQKKQNERGLNENYGRELMELHTLGVDGGYTQKDVTEVARCFTGWTIKQPQLGGEFIFNPKQHDDGEKIVLGIKIPAGGGIHDGEKVLDILARRPTTAHFISRQLAIRFVADNPPESLVDRMARAFLKSDGDLRTVMKTMFESKEFWSEGAYRSKMKSPLEMVASAVRAVNGDVDFAFALTNQVAQLGEPLYRKQEPTGYSNSGQVWMNSAGLLSRMNFV